VKILYHHRTFATDGQEVHIRSLQRGFQEIGCSVCEVALVPKGVGRLEAGALGHGQRIQRMILPRVLRLPAPLREVAEYAYSPFGVRRIVSANRGFDADLLYERYAFGNRAGAVASRKMRLPFVLEVNSPLVDEIAGTRGVVFGALAQRIERFIFSSADLVCVVSDQLRQILVRSGVAPDKMMVVPNGVHLERFNVPTSTGQRAATRAELGITASADSVVVGFVGYFRRWHGLDLLIRAWSACRNADLHLVLVGDGEGASAIASLVSDLAVADRVHLVGARPLDAIPGVLGALDIAVLPAIPPYASPLKLVEYMAARLAIVAPDQPNIHELVRDRESALLFRAGSEQGLAAALQELIHDRTLRERLGRAARASVEHRRLTWRDNAQRIADVIAERSLLT
jgi:glycosyltransferase involved in cell wall biosynthesis